MKIPQAVKKETLHIALGVLIGDAVMLAVFAILKQFDLRVILGTILGSAATIGNFFAMGMALQKAINDPDRAKAIAQGSYTGRMLAMVAVMVIGFMAKNWFHPVAVVVPFLFPKLTIYAMQMLGLFKAEENGGDDA